MPVKCFLLSLHTPQSLFQTPPGKAIRKALPSCFLLPMQIQVSKENTGGFPSAGILKKAKPEYCKRHFYLFLIIVLVLLSSSELSFLRIFFIQSWPHQQGKVRGLSAATLSLLYSPEVVKANFTPPIASSECKLCYISKKVLVEMLRVVSKANWHWSFGVIFSKAVCTRGLCQFKKKKIIFQIKYKLLRINVKNRRGFWVARYFICWQ